MKFYIHTLGCKVNTYESEVMKDLFLNHGYEKGSTFDSDIYVVNTCFVTNVAEHKSLQMIRKYLKTGKFVVVVGCLSQMQEEEVKQLGVPLILGNKDKSKIVEYIEAYKGTQISQIYNLEKVEFENMCLNNFDKTRAFVKIQDGCNNFCSYCIIPYTRGGIRSKKREDVLEEIQGLVASGHKEIVLTGIHTGNYQDGEYDFANLLEDVIKIKGLKRLRISSIEITEINNRVMDVIAKSAILVDHMHIPLQSGSNEILKVMNRKYDVTYFINKIKELRHIRPNMSVTTDVIVGFPFETEELFLETMDTIKTIGFAKLHVFPYSDREGTVASKMTNKVEESVKKERARRLLQLSKQLELEYWSNFLHQTLSFIPEVEKDGYLIGHTGNYLLIKAKGDASLLHQLVSVTIDKIEYPYCLSTICQDIIDNKNELRYNENR